jgi:ribosomal-protein-alanine N-acetyltransferase
VFDGGLARQAQVRFLFRADLDQVAALDQLCYPGAGWTPDQFRQALRRRDCLGLVAEAKDVVLGYCVYRFGGPVKTVEGLAVHPHLRRQGLGRRLLAEAARTAPRSGRQPVVALVREANLPAQQFLAAAGFQALLPILPAYYPDGGNAYRFFCAPGTGVNRDGV